MDCYVLEWRKMYIMDICGKEEKQYSSYLTQS